MPIFSDDIPAVRVEVRMDGSTILLTPLDDAGREMLQRIVDGMPETQQWHFQGSRYTSPMKEKLVGAFYACGGEQYFRHEGNVSGYDYRDAIKVYFDLTAVTDEEALYAMRDYGFYGRVTMESDSTAECLRLRTNGCTVCSGDLTRFIELQWKICDSCSAACEHIYEEGIGTANGRLAYLPFCIKCGRGDPNWSPGTPIEEIAKVVAESGVAGLILHHPDNTYTIVTKE